MSLKGLTRPIPRDPFGTPRQRGFIEDDHARLISAVVAIAKTIGEKVLGIPDALEKGLSNNPDRDKKLLTTLQAMHKAGHLARFPDLTFDELSDLVRSELFGFGPIDRFLSSDDISEIMVNGPTSSSSRPTAS